MMLGAETLWTLMVVAKLLTKMGTNGPMMVDTAVPTMTMDTKLPRNTVWKMAVAGSGERSRHSCDSRDTAGEDQGGRRRRGMATTLALWSLAH